MKNYYQLCVVRAVTDKLSELAKILPKMFDCRFKMAEAYETLPGNDGEGGRRDVLFYVHGDDIGKFAVPRLEYGISWWEDAVANEKEIIPNEILTKYPMEWGEEDEEEDEEEDD
tara:strand:- start:165 stop:506 length:342 start_codon:yes stop_codon:yes gene_type:complete